MKRFYKHFWKALKSQSLWVMALIGTYAVARYALDATAPLGTITSIFTSLVSLYIWFKLALSTHHLTLNSERPDIMKDIHAWPTKWGFLAVLALFHIGMAMLSFAIASIAYSHFYAAMSDLIEGGNIGLSFLVVPGAIVFAIFTLLYLAFSPFIPLSLTTHRRTFRDQLRQNLSFSGRALGYYLIGPVLLAFIVTGLGMAFDEGLYRILVDMVGNDALYNAVNKLSLGIFEGALESVVIISGATAFSLHFLHTAAEDAVDTPSP